MHLPVVKYDEMSNLTREQNIVTPQLAVGARYDALGRQIFWGNTTTTGTDNAAWYSNDGIRPEAVYEANLSRPTGSVGIGTWATNGYRRYVLGPNAYERLAFIDINGAVSFPHTDCIGSTIALSASTSVTKFRYGPVGGNVDPIVYSGGPSSYLYRITGQRIDPIELRPVLLRFERVLGFVCGLKRRVFPVWI